MLKQDRAIENVDLVQFNQYSTIFTRLKTASQHTDKYVYSDNPYWRDDSGQWFQIDSQYRSPAVIHTSR